jgi:anti-anti-sigma factor
MNIEHHKHGAVTVLRPVGPVTLDDADQLRDRLLEEKGRTLGRLVLDATAVPFIDSRGLEGLIEVNDEYAGIGQALKLCGLTDVVREALEITDLAGSFEMFEDVNAAVRSFL